ncbi:MAG TPA: AAA family ATPase, partial [Herpetosiphonaceae bacterium]|nr:AAA family ATPase [Herpetosiphonaceae bacterium]
YALRIAQHSNVIYVAAEGASGYAARKNAWCHHHNVPTGGLHFWLEPVNMLDPAAVAGFIGEIAHIGPALIVVDTLARCMVGGDENSAKDMGLFIDACDRVRIATGATVLTVHHTGKGGDYRGSSAFKGAMDTMIELKNDDGLITVSCAKAKDTTHFASRYLRMVQVGESCVLVPAGQVSLTKSNRLSAGQRTMLEFLALSIFEGTGARSRDIEQRNLMQRSSVYNVLSSLKTLGYISQGAKGDPYFITDDGRAALQREIDAGSLNGLPRPNDQVQQSNGSPTSVQQTLSPVVQEVSHPLRGETWTGLETELDLDIPRRRTPTPDEQQSIDAARPRRWEV